MVNGFASRANTSEVLAVLQKSLFRRRAIELDKSNATCEQSVVHQGNCNRLYEEFIKDARNRIPNFIQLNKVNSDMFHLSDSNACTYPLTKVRYSDAKATQGPRERTKEQSVFIYSNQTMNTAEMYKKELYQGLLKASIPCIFVNDEYLEIPA